MRRLLTTLLLLVLTAAAAPARQQPAAGGARLIDRFGQIQISDFLARADNFAAELQSNPAAKGYVVVYIVPNRLPGFPLRRAQWARGYLVNGRGIDPSRVEVIDGGYSDVDEVKFELWLAEADAKPLVAPFDLGALVIREKSPFLFDRYDYYPPSAMGTGIENGYIGYLDEAGWFAPFVSALRSDPAARGCVIAYATPRDRRGSDRMLAALVKRRIMRTHAIGPDRIVPVAGGQRPHQLVELWLVPPGAALPTPSPATRPTQRRRRHR